MKIRFLTFCICYLLLTVFLGSAEAKKIDTASGAGAGFMHIIPALDSGLFQGKNLFEPDGTLKWLLALYGIEDVRELIALIDTADSRDEAMVAGEEYERDFSPAGATLLGSYLAGLGHDDRLFAQPAAATTASDGPTSPPAATAGDTSPVQATAPGSPGEKVPARKFEGPPIAFLDPPSTIYISEQNRSKKKERNPDKTPAATLEKPPHAVKPRPAPDVPPPVLAPAIAPPDLAGPSVGPEYSGDHLSPTSVPTLPPTSGPTGAVFPADGAAASPAPVPEPATMLLFSTGIAGLAFGRRRRNRSNDAKSKGGQSATG